MLLDNRTLLFSLVLVCAMMALSLAIVSWGRAHDGLKKWSAAMGLESLAWILIAARGEIPGIFSIVVAGTLMITVQAIKLAAIHEYRGLPWPRWQCLLPVGLAVLVLVSLPYDAFRSRLVIGSLVYGAQMLMIVHALHRDTESRDGRAWLLLFWATAAMLPMFALRAISAFFGIFEFAEPQTAVAPNPVQLALFAGFISLSIMGSLGFILMIKEKADRAIRSLAMTDSLTGIYNRRAFMDRAEQEYAIAQRTKFPLALLMLDIDHFKRINDQHGHPAGDAVLVEVARILGANLRKQDTLGRFGGEEFCILLPATDEAGAMVLAEKVRNVVEKTLLSSVPKGLAVTISVGVTVCKAGCVNCRQSFQKLIDDADAALYHAKREGRNRASMLPIGCRDLRAA